MSSEDSYAHLLIKRYKHWDVYLHENQYYLGRMYVWLKRQNVVDLFSVTQLEREELFKIGKELQTALEKTFKPDLYNYAALANVSAHLHLHYIPRYKCVRTFDGYEFKDERWGKNYAPYNYDFKVSETTLFAIRDALKEKLSQ